MKPTALLVDDEADLCKLMQITLTKMGINSDVAYDLSKAYELFNNKAYDFCLTDLALPDGSGLDLVKKVVASGKNTPIAVITAHGTVNLAIEALKLGAFDFVNKPLELSRLRELVQNAIKVANNQDQTPNLKSKEDTVLDERLIGQSQTILSLRETIKKLAKSQAPVFLWGESGTGKEVVAKLIHDLSGRSEGSFVPVNCGAIPSQLMESEFFGHKKGSFTGATTDKIGLFQQAHGGTLFLDEVADLPLAMQVKLLRAIQEKTVRAIGDTKEIPVDIRILSATHKDLNKLVQLGQFRQDLFYRINVIEVKLPTLNERHDDVPLLASHFLSLIANDWQIDIPTLSDDAKITLANHHFEGNVRELRNMLERAITMSEDNIIHSEHLFASHITKPKKDSSSFSFGGMGFGNTTTAINYNKPVQITTEKSGFSGVVFGNSIDNNLAENTNDTPKPDDLPAEGLELFLQNQEKQIICIALTKAHGNKTQAAKLLKMSFRQLRYRMKKLEIDENNDDNNDN